MGQKFDQKDSGSPGAATGSSSGNSPVKGASTTTTTESAGGDATAAEKPNPTDAQKAAVAGGEEVKWDQQGMSWTLPKGWTKSDVGKTTFNYRSAGGGDNGFLIVNISPMGEDFPVDISLKAFYDQAITRKKNGEVEDVRWMELDGLKGVLFREAMPEGQEDPRRLQWIAYRKYAGQTQMVNLMLSTTGRSFDKQADTFYGILYSTKLVH
ncbi:MAG TPA: hypothetical protein VEV81_00820 [Pyrinomonadaceae bacterium]|nr:hypothetical protein [Pyrinomonadaceae bacterium]